MGNGRAIPIVILTLLTIWILLTSALPGSATMLVDGGKKNPKVGWEGPRVPHALSNYEEINPFLSPSLGEDGLRNWSFYWPKAEPLTPSPSDWVVTEEEVRENEIITLTGNLIIKAGGNLTLVNCELYVSGDEWQIRVEEGGVFNVRSSYITTHKFYVYGELTMYDSHLTKCRGGLWLETDEGVVLENCEIDQNVIGILCNWSSNIAITGCVITSSGVGIDCFNSSDITIRDCVIGCGISCYGCSDIYIVGCTIPYTRHCSISCSTSSDINIVNCTIRGYEGGIECFRSSDIVITNCVVNGSLCGIGCCNSLNISITECRIDQNVVGIGCSHSSDIVIQKCIISQSEIGVCCRSFHLVIKDNVFIRGGIYLSGDELRYYASHVIEDNMVNGRPLYYVVNITGPYNVPSDAGQAIIANSRHINLMGANLSCTSIGLQIMYSEDVHVKNCIINKNVHNGIRCYYSRCISIMSCVVSQNGQTGIVFYRSSDIAITRCEVSHNYRHGVFCSLSPNTVIHYCNIHGNIRHGLYVFGAYLVNATYNWWNSTTGPEFKEQGDPYDPEEVYSVNGTEYLLYEPWLKEPVAIKPPQGGTIPSWPIIPPTIAGIPTIYLIIGIAGAVAAITVLAWQWRKAK